MKLDIATLKDLQTVKDDILNHVKELFNNATPTRQWIKTREAMALLKCSRGTLMNNIARGHIEITKIGGTLYFRTSSIMKFMENAR